MTHNRDESMWYVYLLRCSDDSLYCGITTDLDRRVEEHNRGEGAKYTRGRTPVELVYHETAEDRGAAAQREYEIKQMDRSGKEKLILTFLTARS